jgi:hypothetical protein
MKRSRLFALAFGLLLLGCGGKGCTKTENRVARDAQDEYRQPYATKKEYRENFKQLPWEFGGGDLGRKQDIYSCTHLFLEDYRVQLTKEKEVSPHVILQIFDGDEEVFTFKGYRSTVFTRLESVIFVADYHPLSSGCSIVAFDLATRKEVWKAELRGIGPIAHSKYSNHVAISADRDAVLVKGDEAGGRYFELLDAKTGETIAHRIVDGKQK